MKKIIIAIAAFMTVTQIAMSKPKTVTLRVLETSDVHGCFFPYDFIELHPRRGSMARISTYVKDLRKKYGRNVLLFDNGDILQGQPASYYYDYIDTVHKHIAAEIINYMGYDAETMGNHDVETGHGVYDKWIKDVSCPMLGANIVSAATGKPYVKPYTIIERDGVRIGVLGMITPAIPNWLSPSLWSGLRFDEMVSTARKWMKVLKEKEHADVVIGVFHSGEKGGIVTPQYEEDASVRVAREVPGFDLVLFGHDHTRHNETVTNTAGKQVLCLDPANNAMAVADAELTVTVDGSGRNRTVTTTARGTLADVADLPIDNDFMARFKPQYDTVMAYVTQKIGRMAHTISTRPSFFGSSAFNDLILNLELRITNADIAFNAPLRFNASIKKGDITVADMFNLYKFENQLYVMELTGEEIRRHLEMSYDLWANTMTSPADHLLLFDEAKSDNQHTGFKNFTFNFDSAAGIDYEVDVTKPDGQKVHILRMSNGQPFDPEKTYRVAVNSYRGNGGGELLTKGAGIPKDKLEERIVWRSKRDQRYYLMEEIKKLGTIDPKPNKNWRFVPDTLVQPALRRDYKLLFHREYDPENDY